VRLCCSFLRGFPPRFFFNRRLSTSGFPPTNCLVDSTGFVHACRNAVSLAMPIRTAPFLFAAPHGYSCDSPNGSEVFPPGLNGFSGHQKPPILGVRPTCSAAICRPAFFFPCPAKLPPFSSDKLFPSQPSFFQPAGGKQFLFPSPYPQSQTCALLGTDGVVSRHFELGVFGGPRCDPLE